MGELNLLCVFLLLLTSVNSLNILSKSPSLSDSACWKYQCSNSTTFCINPIYSNLTYVLSPCNPDSSLIFCNNTDSSSPVACTTPSSTVYYKSYPGEPCLKSTDCVSSTCYNNVCFGKVLNSACSSNLDCNPGLSCLAGLCTTLLGTGQNCTNDYQCVASAGCNYGVCVDYISLAVGQNVSDCETGDGSSLFCAGSSCFFNYTTRIGQCINSFTSAASANNAPIECSNYKLCIGTSSGAGINTQAFTTVTSCECGNTAVGTMYCFPQDGDIPAVSFRKAWKNFMDAGLVNRCNTERRFEQPCLDLSSDSYLYTRLMNSYYNYFYYTQLVNASSCATEIFFPSYSGAQGLVLALVMLVIAA